MLRMIVCAALLALSAVVYAQGFPSRPLTIVVPFPPGGSTDLVTRLFSQKLSERIGQPVIVENKPGGGGGVGAVVVKSAAPDGHTVLLGNVGTHAINIHLHGRLDYDPVKDYRPVTPLWSFDSFLVVPSASPARTLADLIAYAKAKPGGLNFTSQGYGTAGHILGELLRSETGAQLVHIPMKGAAPAVTEVVAARADLLFSSYITAGPFIRGGKLRILALAASSRSTIFPEVPTIAELGVRDIEFDQWNGMFVPAKTSDAVVRRLNDEFIKAMRHPDVMQMVTSQAAEVITSTPEEFARRIEADSARYGNIVRKLGLKAD